MSTKSLGDKTYTGSLWVIFSKWILRFLGIISTAILARIFTPDDFGIIAIALLVMLLLELILQNGTENYLIRKEHIKHEDYDTAWSIRFFLLTTLSILLSISSEILSEFFNETRLENVFYILSFIMFISGFENIGMVIHRKEFNFRIIFWFTVLKKSIGFIVTVSLAFILKNYWAVIFGLFAFRLTGVLSSYKFSSYRPSVSFSGFIEQWDFSKWVLLNNITAFGREKTEQIIISKMLGTGSMGIYSLAQQVASIPMTELIQPLLITLYSAYSSILNDEYNLSLVFIKVVGVISIIILPLFTGLFILSPIIITLFLGESWEGVVSVLKIMTIITAVQVYIAIFSNILTVLGHAKFVAFVNWMLILLLVPTLILIAKRGDLNELLLSRALLALLFLPVFTGILFHFINLNFSLFIWAFARPALATIAMILSLYFIENVIYSLPDIIKLLLKINIGVIVYCASIVIIWIYSGMKIGGEDFILDKIGKLLLKFNITQAAGRKLLDFLKISQKPTST